MSLNAVQNYVASVLDGLVSPGISDPCNAWVLPPPVVQPAANPQIYVWGVDLDEQRATIPRGSGQKRTLHTIRVTVQWVSSNDPAGVQSFPLLLDAIRGVLRALPLTVYVTDATTGETTQLTDIGERIRMNYAYPVPLEDQRDLQHIANIRLPLYEWMTA